MGKLSKTQRICSCALGALLLVFAPVLSAQGPDAGNLPDYSSLSHHDLTEIGARWDELGDAERRALLKEVKMRMATQKGSAGAVQIRTQRRYGRIVRRSDGRVLRIETKVVEVRPVPKGERSFGVGFERRHGPKAEASGDARSDQATQATAGAPALRVSDPN